MKDNGYEARKTNTVFAILYVQSLSLRHASDYGTNRNDLFQLFNHCARVYNKWHSFVDPPTYILSLGNFFEVSLSVPGLNILEHV